MSDDKLIKRLAELRHSLAIAEREYAMADYIDNFERRQSERKLYAGDIQYYKTAIESLERELKEPPDSGSYPIDMDPPFSGV